jgi:hypothetical protein
MTPKAIFLAVAVVTVINGLFSPISALLFFLSPIWLPEFVGTSVSARGYFAALTVSLGTLIAAGVPAAIFEQIRGQSDSDNVSMFVWLAAAVLLTLPALPYVR